VADVEEGPDPNDVRRHAKRMYTEMQYRQKYRRIDYYRPNDKQRAFHNATAREALLRAGNQCGKTFAGGAQMAMDALAMYPDWYEGRRFLKPPPIERPFEWLGWAACDTSATTRAGVQTKLLGDLSQDDGLGTGLIPLDNIVGKPSMARGIADFVDSVSLRRETGGTAVIRFKTYEQGRKAFQGEPVDLVWPDEDEGDDSLQGEMLARLTTTNGRIIRTMTPVIGMTPVRRRFKEQTPGTIEILMTIWDCAISKGGHIPDERIPEIIASYKEHERATRAFGADMQGEGAVFVAPQSSIKHTLDPSEVPPYWPWMWGVDFRHSGSPTSGHPFAAVLGCWDRDADVIYLMHAIRMLGLASSHVTAMKAFPRWQAPVAWPHDGGRGASIIDGETVAKTYRGLGLNMRPTHATLPTGGFNFEAGLREMENRFDAKKLVVAAHLAEWFDEYQGYHRKDGLVIKVDDDLLSATRQLVMDIRFAKTIEHFNYRRPLGNGPSGRFARGSQNHPDGEFPIF